MASQLDRKIVSGLASERRVCGAQADERVCLKLMY